MADAPQQPQIDTLAAARSGAQQLGAQLADLTLQLAIQQAANHAYAERVAELEQQLAEKDNALDAMRNGQPNPEVQS